jgi:hypothetical protein
MLLSRQARDCRFVGSAAGNRSAIRRSIDPSVGAPGRAKLYGVTQITDTSRTFHIEKYGF